MNDDSLQVFAEEAEDLLSLAEQALLNLDDLDNKEDTLEGINDLFRTFHTIKGAAGLFGLNSIVDFTHIVESVLVKIREDSLVVGEDLVSLFLLSRDHLDGLVNEALSSSGDMSDSLKKAGCDLSEKLNSYLGVLPEESGLKGNVSTDNIGDEESVANKFWHISLRFGQNSLRCGMDPESFINYLKNIGEIKNITLIDDSLPPWSEYDPESCYLGFEIVLSAPDSNKETIEDVFEFVRDDCKITILPPHSHISAYIKMIEGLPEEEMRIGDILVACGALTAHEKDDALNAQDHISDDITAGIVGSEVPFMGQVIVDNNMLQQEVVDAALKKQKNHERSRLNAQQTIRVNAHKLESLVDLVGELVIGSANCEINAARIDDAALNEAMENLLRLVEDVRDTALGLRMVQIGETFNRFKRVIREVSRDMGKEIDLRISGADTELDKTLIEKISDPLMHLVRNAIDHGIESSEKRIAQGKVAKGTISLDAFHDSGSIVIQVKDDGGGLSKEKILKKAIEKGVVQENQNLTEHEIYQLIFEAGFSTAESVSNISGRGVGMDVVRSNVEMLRGQVLIKSEKGMGTTISIRLPLTLAIIDGFQVRVGDAHYIVPLDMVEECMELKSTLHDKGDGSNYINLRGEILPFMYLSDVFGDTKIKDGNNRNNIVVVKYAGKKAGFVVDELLGEHQTVIKPLGKVFQNLKGISGATILGSGEVAMIIDVAAMVDRAVNHVNDCVVNAEPLH